MKSHGRVGPLGLFAIQARELKTGDIICDVESFRNLVVTHTYATAIDQAVDADGFPATEEDPSATLRRVSYQFDDKLIIYRSLWSEMTGEEAH